MVFEKEWWKKRFCENVGSHIGYLYTGRVVVGLYYPPYKRVGLIMEECDCTAVVGYH